MRQEHIFEDEDEAYEVSSKAIAFAWAADTLGAVFLIAFFVAVFFVLGVLSDTPDNNQPHRLSVRFTTIHQTNHQTEN